MLAAPAPALARAAGRAAPRRRACSVRASIGPHSSGGISVPVGSRVRVKDAITVFHAPKQKAGLSLQGLEGIVEKHADVAPDGSLLSCTQPLLVRFELPGDGAKKASFTSHLTTSEVEAC